MRKNIQYQRTGEHREENEIGVVSAMSNQSQILKNIVTKSPRSIFKALDHFRRLELSNGNVYE